MAGCMGTLDVDLIGLEGLTVGSLTVKRSVVLLVCVMLLGCVMFGSFGLELLPIGCFSFETAGAGSILVLTGRGSLYYYLAGDVFLLVFCGIVELSGIGLVGIPRVDLRGWTSERLVIGAVGGLE